jgi:hypothetical protein
MFLEVFFFCCTLCIRVYSLLLFIFYFPILEELMRYFSYCFISINNILLVVICYPSLVVSGFSRN